MSLQSSAAVPPPPLTGGSLRVRAVEVTNDTRTYGKFSVPVMTGADAVVATTAMDGTSPAAGDMLFVTTVTPMATTNTFSTPNKLYVYTSTASFNTSGWELVTSS